MTMTNFSDTGA